MDLATSKQSCKTMATVLWLLAVGALASCQQQQGSGGSLDPGEEEERRQELNFLVLLPFEIPGFLEQPSYTDGPILLPSAELAVEQINQREDVLPGYYVNVTVANSACNLQSETLLNFVEPFFHSGRNFSGIVGPGCSGAAELVSAITGENRIAILNFHIVSSPRLTDRTQYGYSFGTVGSSRSYVELFLKLMRENDWQSVAVFYEESKIFYVTAYSLLIEELQVVYPEGNIVFSAPISETYLPVSAISDHRVRVIFVLSTSDLMHRMLCIISRSFPYLHFPTYQFVFMEVRNYYFYYPADFTFNNRRYECSVQEITQAMEGALLTHVRLELTDHSSELVSKMTYGEYWKLYEEKVRKTVENGSTTEWGNPTYDGVWSLALSLNNSIPKLSDLGMDLSDYTYGNSEATNIIRDEAANIEFQGASGTISFDNNTGYTSSMVDLHQLTDNTSVLVGLYSEDTQQLEMIGTADFVENDFEAVELLVHPALATLFLLSTAVALVLILTAHVLTLIYHNFTTIKASSYRLSQLIFAGCYILVISIIALSAEKVAPSSMVNIPSLCAIQAWSLPLSATLILGTVAVKTWRLYQIFVHLKKPGKFLTDWALIIVVLALVGVDVVLCLVWTTAFQFTTLRRETIHGADKIDVIVECDSRSYFVWFGVLTALQGVIMFIALALALLTKKIRHESFKTKGIVLLVYFLTITLLLGFPIYFIVQVTNVSGPNADYAILALTLNIVLYLCFFFLFFPPILSLLREKMFYKVPGLRRFARDAISNATYQPSSYNVTES